MRNITEGLQVLVNKLGAIRGRREDSFDRPVGYIPSNMEREWGERVASGSEDGCSFIRSNAHRVKEWLTTVRVRLLACLRHVHGLQR